MPFRYNALVGYRGCLNAEFLVDVNETLLSTLGEKEGETQKREAETVGADAPPNAGKVILDATCSSFNIKYPQDYQILNAARENLEVMI